MIIDFWSNHTIMGDLMNIRVEILDVVMDQLASEADYTEIEGVLAPLYSDNRLKLWADRIFRAAVNLRTNSVEHALAVGMGLEQTDTMDPVATDELSTLLASWYRCERLTATADELLAATRRMCENAAERARALGATMGAGAAWLVFEQECEECNCGD